MDWKAIRDEFETTDITLKALAEKHEVKLPTLKSRKRREEWQKDASSKPKDASQDATQKTTAAKEEIQVAEPENLTEKQRLFCMHYIRTFNATQSAIKAGYSADTAFVIGHENLRKPKIADYIRELKANMTDDLFLDARDILRKYAAIAFADITDFMTFGKKEIEAMGMFGPLTDDEGNTIMKEVNYVDFKESAAVDGTIITEAKQGKDGVSIKLADKMKALEKLEQYFELLPENMKHRVQKEKMQADIAKAQAETKRIEQEQEKEQADANGVFILNDKEAMRKEMERRASRSREDDGHHGPD